MKHLILLAALASTAALAADVTGRVLGPGGQPAAHARVYVDGLPRGTLTDAAGRFRIGEVPPGKRTLVVESTGAARWRGEVAVADDRPQEVDVRLAPNLALVEAARRYREPQPERMAQKQAYLDALEPGGRALPNIVLILFDDLGWGDLGVYGNRLIRTPNIDALARSGVRLTEFYAVSPVCSPSRASLMTGRYPGRSLSGNHVFFPESSPVKLLRSAAGLPNAIMPDEIMLPEMLARIGYRTAMFGKWHLGDRPGRLPNDLGFQTFLGVRYSNDMQPLDLWRNGEIAKPATEVRQDELTRTITDGAVAEIEAEADGRPLFLYVPFTAPHVPHAIAPGRAGRSRAGLYGDVVEELDESVGRIRDALRRKGIERNTLILITSDNGADRRGDPGPFLGRKQETFEGGQRVPLIAVWPGRLPRNQVRDGMSMLFDLPVTIMAALGLPMPQDRVMDGQDIMPLLAGRTGSPHPSLFYLNAWSGEPEAVRDARYKYRAPVFDRLFTPFYPGDIALPISDPAMLTDLRLDRENHDLSELLPAKRQELAERLARFRDALRENPRGWR